MQSTFYVCPVCGYDRLDGWPGDDRGTHYPICDSCGFGFGFDDATHTYAQWREEWMAAGMKWSASYELTPENWDPVKQLENLQKIKFPQLLRGQDDQ